MLDFRTIALGLGVFGATFLVGWYLNIGNLAGSFAVAFGKPVTATPVPAATQAAVRPGNGLTDDKRLRKSVVLRSQAYRRPTCRQDARSMYVIAASRYAEVLMRAAGCNNFPKCPMSEGMLNRVWLANRSAYDLPVARAMAAAHAAGGLSDRNFRGDIGRAVRVIAGRGFAAGPPPRCVSHSSTTRRFRFRIRFRR